MCHSLLSEHHVSPLSAVLTLCVRRRACTHLKGQVRNDAGDSKANQEQVGEDESSGGVDNFLDLFVRATRLTGLPEGTGVLDVSRLTHWPRTV